MEIGCTKHVLPNGLDVLIHEDHGLPIVAVNLWYHVGSKNEQPGRTGFAHLFEHLMFEGSAHYDRGYFHPLQRAGAVLNGSTNADRTNYWEVVPTGALELALWMESDRMGYLLPALTEAKFANQRDVVLNERRQNYENRPYGLAPMAVLAALFPPDHPYHWPTIGSADDLRATRLDEVRDFFVRFYHPANASLALAGDIDTDAALALAERYFGDIPPGPAVDPMVRDGSLPGEVRLVLEDASSCRASTSPGTRPRSSRLGTPSWTWWRTCSATRRSRACTGAWSSRTGWRPTSAPCSSRASFAASSRWWRPRRRAMRSPSWTSRSAARSTRWHPAAQPPRNSSAASRRPRRSSCSGCRRSAASAASRIS